MNKLTLVITVNDNAAFADNGESAELSTILRNAAIRVREGDRDFGLFDTNGNNVGTATWSSVDGHGNPHGEDCACDDCDDACGPCRRGDHDQCLDWPPHVSCKCTDHDRA